MQRRPDMPMSEYSRERSKSKLSSEVAVECVAACAEKGVRICGSDSLMRKIAASSSEQRVLVVAVVGV